MKNTPENDRSEYTDTGFRDGDARRGFGDDGGTRIGRPDGASANASLPDPNPGEARPAPYDAQGGRHIPGQAGTNTTPVADGIEGSDLEGEEQQGQQQSRIQAASEGIDEGPIPSDNNRRVDDL